MTQNNETIGLHDGPWPSPHERELLESGDREHAAAETASNADLGAILGSMVAYDQALSNSLIDRIIDEYIEFIDKTDQMVDAIERVNDSIKVDRAMNRNMPGILLRGDAHSKIEHLRGLKMGGRA